MKRILTLLLALTTLFSLFACAAQDPKEALAYDYDLSAYATLPDYMALKFAKDDVTATKDDLDKQKTTDFAGRDIESTVKKDDTVNIDYVGKRDGKEFEGGSAKNQSLKIGSKSFIDGFEDGLIGKKPGETVDLNLTFPTDYHNKDLAGAAVVFTVTINYIKTDSQETPKLTDELVARFTDYKTVEEYEKAMNEKLSAEKLDTAVQNALLDQTTFHKLPDAAIRAHRDVYVNYYKDIAASYGMNFSTYLQQTGTNEVSFLAQANSYAENAVQSDLILYTISREQNITVTEEQRKAILDEMMEEYKETYAIKDHDDLLELLGDDADKLILQRVIVDFVSERIVIAG